MLPKFNVSPSHKTELRLYPGLAAVCTESGVLSVLYCGASSLSPMPPVMNVMNMKTSGSQAVQCPCLDFPFYPGRISNVRLDECKGG